MAYDGSGRQAAMVNTSVVFLELTQNFKYIEIIDSEFQMHSSFTSYLFF